MCTTQMSIEYSQGWISENPVLFAESLNQWHQQTTKKGLKYRSVDRSRTGFVTYTAQIEETV